jgi:hypothetical protein
MSLKQFSLHSTFVGCPIYWQNFIIFLQSEFDLWNRDVSVPVIQRELRPYGGRYHMAGSESNDYIEFDTEEQFAWFVLRWS